MRRLIPALLLATSACATVGPNYQAPASASLGVPSSYHGAAPTVQSDAQLATWWTSFNDPVLTELVGKALGANQDLAVAQLRLRQARESVVQARAGQLPTVDASASAGRSVDKGGSRGSYSLSGDASWEADLFGGNRRSVEASKAEAQSSEYDLASVQVSLVAELASAYVDARAAQQRKALAERQLANLDDNLQIAQWRLQAGLVSSIDVEQAKGQRASTAASVPTYQQAYENAAFRIGVLTGQAPGGMATTLATPADIPAASDQIAAGAPADTLRQRPDVRSAERTLAAQTARIGVAEAELYPKLRLSGSLGTSALGIGGLIDAITGSLFSTLTQTLFDGGRNRSAMRSQEAAAEGAFATYKQSVLTALEDVENALVALRTAEQRQPIIGTSVEAANNQAILARSQYRAGLSDYQALLEAERGLISAQDSQLTNRADRSQAIIQLYRALGGGWSPLAASQGQ